jgi:hypothetical protein
MYELHDGANRNDRLLVGMAIATRIAALALGVETALLSAAVGATIF